MTLPLIDTHVHLNDPRLLRRLDAVLVRARVAGVVGMIVIGWDVESSELAIQLAQEHPDVWATVGIHPHGARGDATPENLRKLRELAKAPRVVAIGETGLDFYRDLSPRDIQGTNFRWHLELAQELNLPVMCHCREAEEALLETLAKWPQLTRVWHCFDGTAAQAQAAAAQGIWVSLGGTITYPDSDWRQEMVAATPLTRMLLETDAPYLAPYPKEGKRPRDNEPAYLPRTAERAAELQGVPVAELAATTTENARRVFGLGEE